MTVINNKQLSLWNLCVQHLHGDNWLDQKSNPYGIFIYSIFTINVKHKLFLTFAIIPMDFEYNVSLMQWVNTWFSPNCPSLVSCSHNAAASSLPLHPSTIWFYNKYRWLTAKGARGGQWDGLVHNRKLSVATVKVWRERKPGCSFELPLGSTHGQGCLKSMAEGAD